VVTRAAPHAGFVQPQHRVGDLVRAHCATYLRAESTTPLQGRVLKKLASCRTPELGGYVDLCDVCDFRRVVYNPCRNRHCPSCEGQAAKKWLAEVQARLLPTHHFHVVFTLPGDLRSLAFQNAKLVYDLMQRAAGQALLEAGKDPKFLGAQLGAITVLHTWTRELLYHPHVHCVVTGGGLTPDGARWKESWGKKYLAPTALLGKHFRDHLACGLDRLARRGELRLGGECRYLDTAHDADALAELLEDLRDGSCFVYAKTAFNGLDRLVRYLARYTHRVGISDRRLLSVSQDEVTFATKSGRKITLHPHDFLHRFLLHVLPHRLVKIRHYGLYSNAHRKRLALARAILVPHDTPLSTSESEPPEEPSLGPCPQCFFGLLTREDVPANPVVPLPWP